MGATTKIKWADASFNPWTGCTKVSPACDNCYAEAWAKRAGHPERWQGERARTSTANWRIPLKLDRQAAAEGRRLRVFCASLADVFDNQVPEAWRSDLWQVIEDTPHLDWLLLTKRPQNILKMIWPKWDNGLPSNVWVGTTVENQEEADRRIPHLLQVPAKVRFLSCEPLLGDVFLPRYGVHWVIAGGESGPRHRPMNLAHARSLRDQCALNGTAFFFKQVGGRTPDAGGHELDGRVMQQMPVYESER